MFKTDHNPTFSTTVQIPAPGGKLHPLAVTFKWLARDGFIDYCKNAASKPDPEFFSGLIDSWDADVPCNQEGMTDFFNKWPRAGRPLFDAYRGELLGVEEKN